MSANRDKLIKIYEQRVELGGDPFEVFLACAKYMSEDDCARVIKLNEFRDEDDEEESEEDED